MLQTPVMEQKSFKVKKAATELRCQLIFPDELAEKGITPEVIAKLELSRQQLLSVFFNS